MSERFRLAITTALLVLTASAACGRAGGEPTPLPVAAPDEVVRPVAPPPTCASPVAPAPSETTEELVRSAPPKALLVELVRRGLKVEANSQAAGSLAQRLLAAHDRQLARRALPDVAGVLRLTRDHGGAAPRSTSLTFELRSVETKSLVRALAEKGIYLPDDRIDLYEMEAKRAGQRKNAATVVALVLRRNLRRQDSGWRLRTTPYVHDGRRLCPGERFRDQPVGAFCSGVLVGDDIVATAAHCIVDFGDAMDDLAFVLDFAMLSESEARTEFADTQVFFAERRIDWSIGYAQDWALIRLRGPTGRPHAHVRTSGAAELHDDLYVVGHPQGLPAKFADGAQLVDDSDPELIVANLDTYGGNSGSPVFGPTDEIEGLLIRGANDFDWDEDLRCYRSAECPTTGCRGEVVTRASNFIGSLPGA